MNNKETMSWIISSDTKVYVVNQTKQTESTGHCRKKRGFTLVELIVVLTILAILASILIPALTGYIDKANGTRIVSKARNLLTASQTVVSSHYAKEPAFDRTTTYFRENGLSNAIIELSEAEGEFECSIGVDEQYKVTSLLYSENDRAAYYNGEWQVLESASRPDDTPIVIKGTQIQVPGSYYTELANSGVYTSEYDLALLRSVEEMQRQAIQKYKDEKLSGKYAFKIKFNNGNAFIADTTRDIQSRVQTSRNIVKDGYMYIIVVNDNQVGTNLTVNPNAASEYKIGGGAAHLRIDANNNTFYGFDMKTYQ